MDVGLLGALFIWVIFLGPFIIAGIYRFIRRKHLHRAAPLFWAGAPMGYILFFIIGGLFQNYMRPLAAQALTREDSASIEAASKVLFTTMSVSYGVGLLLYIAVLFLIERIIAKPKKGQRL